MKTFINLDYNTTATHKRVPKSRLCLHSRREVNGNPVTDSNDSGQDKHLWAPHVGIMNTEASRDVKTSTERKKIARKRWHMLAQVLQGESCSNVIDSTVSVRRFQSYGLLSTQPVQHDSLDRDQGGDWFLYTCQDLPGFSMNIRHLSGAVTAERLNGFNNTGNVCVWPSEEVMTFYCMQHVQDFKGLKICELGGGMTCLAGVALGIYSEAAYVEVTDGNEESIKNLQSIIENNTFGNTLMNARVLQWGSEKVDPELQSLFDIVICADCLFFDDGREELATLIFDILKPGGHALLFAPSRNKTFYKFADLAQKCFQVSIDMEYDSTVWNAHCKLLAESPNIYDESLHFPILMKLTKPLSTSRDVTPESR